MQTTQQAITQAVSVLLARRQATRTWLADEIGMNLASLSNRLSGKTALDTQDIDQIAQAFGLSGFDLLSLAQAEVEVSSERIGA